MVFQFTDLLIFSVNVHSTATSSIFCCTALMTVIFSCIQIVLRLRLLLNWEPGSRSDSAHDVWTSSKHLLKRKCIYLSIPYSRLFEKEHNIYLVDLDYLDLLYKRKHVLCGLTIHWKNFVFCHSCISGNFFFLFTIYSVRNNMSCDIK